MKNLEKIQQIIHLYQSGSSQQFIASSLNISQTSISSILKKHHIIIRPSKITYPIDQTFFQSINNEYNAYFLGLLYADGNITPNQITLKLHSKDQIILEKFKDIISPTSPIKQISNYSYFRINQKAIASQLIYHGCLPKKSLILQFPLISSHLIRHFIRGYSDGDGSISPNKSKHHKTINYLWRITSTKPFCQAVSNILYDNFKIAGSQSYCKNKISVNLTIGGNKQAKQVLDWLYQDSLIYLPRKYEKYLEFLSYLSSSKSYSNSGTSDISKSTSAFKTSPSSDILNSVP